MTTHIRHGGRWLVIAAAVVAVSILHFGVQSGDMGLHAVHREFYFVPILLAAFWFGLRLGLAVSATVSGIYLAGLAVVGLHHQTPFSVAAQVFVFLLTAGLIGWLADRQRREQARKAREDRLATLAQAAGALGQDLHAFVTSMESLRTRAGGLGSPGLDQEFMREMGRARILLSVVDSFVPAQGRRPVAVDINRAVESALDAQREKIAARGVRVQRELESGGCLAWADEEQVAWIVDKLMNNALEATPHGGTVCVTTWREADVCRVSVQDEGPGIAPEHREKIFTPFFTTKPGSNGLALASSLRTAREMGGALTFESEPGKGATFTLSVPRSGASGRQGRGT